MGLAHGFRTLRFKYQVKIRKIGPDVTDQPLLLAPGRPRSYQVADVFEFYHVMRQK